MRRILEIYIGFQTSITLSTLDPFSVARNAYFGKVKSIQGLRKCPLDPRSYPKL
jgi:hypothetical protein